jgi:hypothetical protein
VKLLTEYIERALQLEALADGETDLRFKAELLKQAPSYRKLAAKRAEQYGLPCRVPRKNRPPRNQDRDPQALSGCRVDAITEMLVGPFISPTVRTGNSRLPWRCRSGG